MHVAILSSGFPSDSLVKNPPANSGDSGWIPGSGRFPGGGNGNPLYYSCPGNPMDRGASDPIRSVAQSCPTLCDPMNSSMPGLPVRH